MLLAPVNQKRAQELQLRAYDLNSSLLKPRTFIKAKKVQKLSSQVKNFTSRLQEYSTGSDIAIALDEIISQLLYSPDQDFKKFENSIKKLGYFLGFNSTQPDQKSDGPDNFWRGEHFDFVIECKNQAIGEVSRDETSQMLSSKRWYSDLYAEIERLYLVMFHNENLLKQDAYGDSEFNVVNSASLNSLKTELRSLSDTLSSKRPGAWQQDELQSLLKQHNLNEKSILETFTKKVQKQR